MKIRFIILAITCLPGLVWSQSGRMKLANQHLENRAYYYAAEAFEDVVERSGDSLEIAARIARSYYELGRLDKAKQWYAYLQEKEGLSKDEMLNLIATYRQLGEEEKALSLIKRFQIQYGNHFLNDQLVKEQELLATLATIPEEPAFTLQTFERGPGAMNSGNSEISVAYYQSGEAIVTTNQRYDFVRRKEWARTNDTYFGLSLVKIGDKGQLNHEKKVGFDTKTAFHTGTVVYDSIHKFVYFSANVLAKRKPGSFSEFIERIKTNEDDEKYMRIYRGTINDNMRITNIEEVPVNDAGSNTMHPSLSADGKTLYFASDRPGGMGGMDLYRMRMEDVFTYGDVENLGEAVNTPGDEAFPFVRSTDNLLFFASNGHPGLGGYDIFMAHFNSEGKVVEPQNLGAPINSRMDDFSFVNNADQTAGYFSSNRADTSFSNMDLVYAFEQHEVFSHFEGSVKGIVTNEETKEPLADVLISLKNAEGEVVDTVKTDKDGKYLVTFKEKTTELKVVATSEIHEVNQKVITVNPTTNDYKADLTMKEMILYHIAGTVSGKATKTATESYPLADVKVAILDQADMFDTIYVSYSKADGSFKTPYMTRWKKGDEFKATLVLYKKGYSTVRADFDKVLDEEERIFIHDTLIAVDMHKIDVGMDLDQIVDISNLNNIYFDLDKSNIRPDASSELKKVIDFLNFNPGVTIEIRSHTDSRADDLYNMLLSEKRARSVRDYLINNGVPENRIKARGYGEQMLKISDEEIARESTWEAKERLHEKNRRTEFIIVESK